MKSVEVADIFFRNYVLIGGIFVSIEQIGSAGMQQQLLNNTTVNSNHSAICQYSCRNSSFFDVSYFLTWRNSSSSFLIGLRDTYSGSFQLLIPFVHLSGCL